MKKKIIFDVVGALIKRKGKILVCQRSDLDLFGSLWEYPGGKVEKHEKGAWPLFVLLERLSNFV